MSKLKRRYIKKDLLEELYLNQKLNLKEVGNIIGFSARTVGILAKEFNMPLRPAGIVGPHIEKEDLMNLYLKKGLSSRKIAKIYKCAYSYIDTKLRAFGLPVKTFAAAHITTKRVNFSGNIAEKAYLIGFRIGDLRVRKMYKNSETILVDCGSTKLEQIKLIKKLFTPYGRVWVSEPKENDKIQIECSLNLSFSFLLPKYKEFPYWTLNRKKTFLNILAGFTDAEGCFYLSKDKERANFSIGNYNTAILLQIQKKLIYFGFKPRLFRGVLKGYTGKDGCSHNYDYWILILFRKSDVFNFTQLILPYLRHNDKIMCAKKVINNIKQRNEKFGYKGIGMLKFKNV